MIDRLYDNGMLMNGEARHCNCWEYPTMPRLRRDVADDPSASGLQPSRQELISRKRGYVALLIDVFRAR